MSQNRKAAKVSALVHYLKQKLEGDAILHNVLVEGEISNMRRPYTGHWYFSLKDEKSQISAVMFASSNRRLKFDPKNGDRVVVKGDVSVYEAGGTMQLIISDMTPYGTGDLYRQLELLKEKLFKEGLFAEEHKKKLPLYPMNIALVTGNSTAAREDVLITLKKRWPCAEVHEYPCPVQGMDAPPKIIEALLKADAGGHEVILLVRGGGSLEDLWCFNDENLARTVYRLNTPVVTGIGHEIDFTLCDYTSDVRANTPTGAVETAVPDMKEVLKKLSDDRNQMRWIMEKKIQNASEECTALRALPVFSQPQRMLTEHLMEVSYCLEKISRFPEQAAMQRHMLEMLKQEFSTGMTKTVRNVSEELKVCRSTLAAASEKMILNAGNETEALKSGLTAGIEKKMELQAESIRNAAALLDAYSPLKILSRGYSIVTKDDAIVSSAADIDEGDLLKIRLSDGKITAKAVNVEASDG